MVGDDPHGHTLRSLLERDGVDCSGFVVDNSQCTALAVLPLFIDGTRGCFVTLGANAIANATNLLSQNVMERVLIKSLRVFHFGYPHLMQQLQGPKLRQLFDRVQSTVPNVLLTMDLNGANITETAEHQIVLPALEITAAVHANLEEACVVTGLAKPTNISSLTLEEIRLMLEWFTARGVGIACITCGKEGAFIATGGEGQQSDWAENLRLSQKLERGCFFHMDARKIADGVKINASGAGDSFMAGVVAELSQSAGGRGVNRVAQAGFASALHRLDPSLAGQREKVSIDTLVKLAEGREKLPSRFSNCTVLRER